MSFYEAHRDLFAERALAAVPSVPSCIFPRATNAWQKRHTK